MPDFGEVSILYTDFDGLVPDETPLRDGGKWGEYSNRPPLKVRDTGGSIHGTVDGPVCGSVFVAKVFVGNVIEAYGCTPGSGLGAALESHRIVALIGDPDAYNGYSSGYGGGISEGYFFRRYTEFGFGPLDGIVAGTDPGPPEKLGIRITPDRVEQWAYAGGTWTLVQTGFDTTHRGAVRFALETEEQGGTEEVAWECFAAGIPRRTQFFRWTRGFEEQGV